MSEQSIFKDFESTISEIRLHSDQTPELVNNCIESFKQFKNLPQSGCYENQLILNEKINTLCEASGASQELIIMKMNLP